MRPSAMRTALRVQTWRGAGGRHADAGTSRVQIGSLSRARGRLHASCAHACTEAGARMVAPVATRLDVQRHSCTVAQLHSCTVARLHNGTSA